MNSSSVIFIVGPTAVGKSQIALELARRLKGEIISCDAMQVYREVAIASDKPSAQQRALIPHHCVDHVPVTEEFNVGRFRQEAVLALEDIKSRGKIPIFCGGSGMYMTVMLDGIFEQASRDKLLRERLQKQAVREGISSLHRKLGDLDPVVAAKIHPHDAKRIIRALEVCMTAGTAMSQLQTQREGLWGKMPVTVFALNRPRDILYKRVEDRIDYMFEHGLVEEIQKILAMPLSLSARTLIGIREVGGYLNGEYDLPHAKYLMKLNTRHFVKRQLTWFRRDKRLQWIELNDQDSVAQTVDHMQAQLAKQ